MGNKKISKLYEETNEKFVGRVENMIYNICGCNIKRGKEILLRCLKRNKEKEIRNGK